MEQSVKINLTNINKIEKFKRTMRKLTIDEELEEAEKSYILSCAILFLRYYNSDKRFKSYRDFAYYIILKYSLKYNDYQPLYDFSVNFGFYPIARNIIENDLLIDVKINTYLLDLSIDKYKNSQKNYIETYEQKEKKEALLSDDSPELSYIAPTSFGKSSIIVNYIEQYNRPNIKIGVIVPTKSLLMQTYKMIRDSQPNNRIIIHDEMYQDDETYIAVFTQERALRLINKNDTYFDVLFIDEAHNIFEKNSRNILMSRLINKNMKLNPEHKVVYLSPLIMDSNNLKLNPQQKITEQRINFNIKEAEILEFRLNKNVYKYNRFVNQFYWIEKANKMISYIKENSKYKNFIYIRSPQKIEKFAEELSEQLISLDEKEEIKELLKILSENVHEDFYAIKLIKKGIIYLHGKLPDLIKEYLESKYQKLKNLKYIIANTVILEGMNLSIDTLFILNTHSLYGKELTNLIGRVNRLNEIFVPSVNRLNKLLPQVHFINNEEYYRKNSNMTNIIKSLRNRIFDDDIKNPVLESFDFESLTDEEKKKYKSIKDKENFITESSENESDLLKKYLIEEGIDLVYSDLDNVLLPIYRRINKIKEGSVGEWQEKRMLDKIYYLFIKELEDEIDNFEFSRLSNEKARNYYETHIKNSHRKTLKENVNLTVKYFIERVKKGDGLFYFGGSYGEVARETGFYTEYRKKVYVDLSQKSKEQLVNLAIVKLKMENDFVSFIINKFILMMYDYELIFNNDYNLYIYGTMDKAKIKLTKFGLSGSLISRLESDGQLDNIYFDKFGNLQTNDEFEEFRNSVDDFYKFQINKFL